MKYEANTSRRNGKFTPKKDFRIQVKEYSKPEPQQIKEEVKLYNFTIIPCSNLQKLDSIDKLVFETNNQRLWFNKDSLNLDFKNKSETLVVSLKTSIANEGFKIDNVINLSNSSPSVIIAKVGIGKSITKRAFKLDGILKPVACSNEYQLIE